MRKKIKRRSKMKNWAWVVRGIKIGIAVSIPIIILACVIKTGNIYIKVYNGITKDFMQAQNSLANLDTEYQRRYALIDNFASVVKETKEFEKYIMKFERETYSAVAEAKASATKMSLEIPDETKKRLNKEEALGNILVNLLDKIAVYAQQYPQITDPNIKEHSNTFKAFSDLKEELKGIESDIRASRQLFNESVMVYNTNVSMFPANVIARTHNFKKLESFSIINERAKEDAKISF
jgi:LemA protein